MFIFFKLKRKAITNSVFTSMTSFLCPKDFRIISGNFFFLSDNRLMIIDQTKASVFQVIVEISELFKIKKNLFYYFLILNCYSLLRVFVARTFWYETMKGLYSDTLLYNLHPPWPRNYSVLFLFHSLNSLLRLPDKIVNNKTSLVQLCNFIL